MSIIADKTGHGFIRLRVGEEECLGLKVSGHKRSVAGQLQSLRRGHGWIVSGERVENWEVDGLVEHEGAIYAYGPYHEHEPVSAILSLDRGAAASRVFDLIAALYSLHQQSIDPGRFEPELVLKLTNGGYLFLPGSMVDAVLSAETAQERIVSFDPYNHPDMDGERNACFFVATLLYRVLTGKLPYAADTSEEIHQRIRRLKVLPPHLVVPELHPDLSDLVVRSFDSTCEVTLEEWREEAIRFQSEGIAREIDEDERKKLTATAERLGHSSESEYRRLAFFRTHWRTMAIVAAIVVIIGSVGGTILKNALKPRITVGMSAVQVVRLFYTSINSFDSQAMQDCVVDGAGKAAIEEATNLFVISRVRQGYSGSTGYVTAQKWLDAGKPKLKTGISVYGVADLQIQQDSPGVYTVSYQAWQPAQTESSPNSPSAGNAPPVLKVQGRRHVDRVYLKDEGKFWAIYRIDHVVSTKIGSPVTVTESQATPSQTAQ